MFIHNFKYALKTLFRDKMLIFWTFAFPIILGTFFNMAFSNIENSEKLEIINIAIVENEEFKNSELFKETIKTLSDEANKDRLFKTEYTTKEKAEELLKESQISGYILLEDKPKVVVSTNGINETIVKYVIEEIVQTEEIMKTKVEAEVQNQIMQGNFNINYEKIYKDVLGIVQGQEANFENISNSNLSYTMIEFYTLIAMTCLYGGILGMVAINQNLANMSNNGKRVAISPTSKGKIIFSSIIASYITQLLGLALLFMYTVFVLKVDYGNNLPLIIALGMAGSFAGLTMGVAIGTLLKANENVKTGIVISVTMLGCFLSGMMGITMKYIVDTKVPIVNKINPASIITDGFYSLYYYDTLDRYLFDIVSLLIFALVMIAVAFFSLRKQKYESL